MWDEVTGIQQAASTQLSINLFLLSRDSPLSNSAICFDLTNKLAIPAEAFPCIVFGQRRSSFFCPQIHRDFTGGTMDPLIEPITPAVRLPMQIIDEVYVNARPEAIFNEPTLRSTLSLDSAVDYSVSHSGRRSFNGDSPLCWLRAPCHAR
jgi:hypothetical protein